MERKEQRLINKIFKLLILFIALFIIFGNISFANNAESFGWETSVREFGEPVPTYRKTIGPFIGFVFGGSIFAIIILGIITIGNMIINVIGKKEKIFDRSLALILFVLILILIGAGINFLLYDNFNNDSYDDVVEMKIFNLYIIQLVTTFSMTFFAGFGIIDIIRKLIDKDRKINKALIILFIISLIIFSINYYWLNFKL